MDLILTILTRLVQWRGAVTALLESRAGAESPGAGAAQRAGRLPPPAPPAESPPVLMPPWAPVHAEHEVLDLLRAGNRIGAVYAWQRHTGAGFRAAQAAVTRLAETAGISAPRG